MGQGRSLPRFHTEQQSPDGFSVISDPFHGTDLCDDYDAFTESMVRALKAPDMTHMPIVYKETIVEESEDGSFFEVKVALDPDRFAQKSGAKQEVRAGEHGRCDYIVAHKKYTFSYEKRTLSAVAYKDHWGDVPPEIAWQGYFSFGTPLRLEFHIMSNGKRHACEKVADEFRPLISAIEFDLRKDRLPEAKLTWDPDRLCLHTGRMAGFTDYDDLYDNLLVAVRQSLTDVVPKPSVMPAGLAIEQLSVDRSAVMLTASSTPILELTCEHNSIEGHILRTYSSDALPNLKFQVSREPLVVKVFLKQKDNMTDFRYEHVGGHDLAQKIIDKALALKFGAKAVGLSEYVANVAFPFRGGFCAQRGWCSSRTKLVQVS